MEPSIYQFIAFGTGVIKIGLIILVVYQIYVDKKKPVWTEKRSTGLLQISLIKRLTSQNEDRILHEIMVIIGALTLSIEFI